MILRGSVEPSPASLKWHLERWGLAAVCSATLAAALLAARNRWAPYQGPLTLGLVFWLWLLAFHLVIALAGGLAGGRLDRRGWERGARGFRIAAATVVLGVAATLNNPAWNALLGLEGAARYRWLLPVCTVLALAGLTVSGLTPLRRRRGLRLLALLAAGAALGAFLPPRSAVRGEPAVFVPGGHPSGERLLLIGLDGADWRFIDALSGQLPNLERLKVSGAWGPPESLRPTLSPRIWTTIATGKEPKQHRILDFTTLRVRGVHAPILRRHSFARSIRGLGFGPLLSVLHWIRVVFESPITSVSRRVPAYWNIATAQQAPVSVLNWWATWPAEPVLGAIVSERIYYERLAERGVPRERGHSTYPESLAAEIAPLVTSPSRVRYDDARPFMDVSHEEFVAAAGRAFQRRDVATEFPHFYSMFQTNRSVALHLIERGRAEFGESHDLLVLFRLVDQASHTALRFSELVDPHLRATPEELRRYGGVVSEAYRAADRAIGELIAAFGDGNVLVVSDHGFGLEHFGEDETPVYDHRWAPPGIFIASGPAFRPGRVDGLGVLDVMPALLYLKGFAIADDMPGRVAEDLFDETFLQNHPATRVASYRQDVASELAGGTAEGDEQMLERLRALGYIN